MARKSSLDLGYIVKDYVKHLRITILIKMALVSRSSSALKLVYATVISFTVKIL